MSANIYYSQIQPKKRVSVSCFAPSAFSTAMDKAFNEGNQALNQWTLDSSNIETLKGMAATNSDAVGNPYNELIEAIHKFGPILVEAVY